MSVKYKDENGVLQNGAGLYTVTKPIGMADIYSTEEKEVGLWKNNKPLYQKTIIIGNGDVNVNTDSGNGTYRAIVDSGVSNIDEGFAVVDKSFMILSSDSSPRYFTWIDYQGKGASQFVVYTNASRTNVTVVLTIQYTKTTDTPWSGKFVPQGYGYVSSGDIYSLEERQVGVYFDGKPLYQRTFVSSFSSKTKASRSYVAVTENMSSSDYSIIDINGYIQFTDGNRFPISIYATEFIDGSTDTNSAYVSYVVNATGVTTLLRQNFINGTASGEIVTTIKYTKTTDVAGSGIYVPSGDKAVHYSTDEEVIGTWIDGKTIYRRVIKVTSNIQLTANTWVGTGINATNIHRIIRGELINQSPANVIVSVAIQNNAWSLNSPRSIEVTGAATDWHLILEYTKTS